MTKPKQTKIARVQGMLERPSGATVEALCKTTGWQAHSVRAALTGLRKAGHVGGVVRQMRTSLCKDSDTAQVPCWTDSVHLEVSWHTRGRNL